MRRPFLLCSLLFAFIAILFHFSCRKLDEHSRVLNRKPVPDFFDVPSNAPFAVKRIAETIDQQNKNHHFLNAFIQKQGIPRWSQTVIMPAVSTASRGGGGGNDSIVIIPLVKQDSLQVHGFLACLVRPDTVRIRLFDASTYAAYGFSKGPDSISAAWLAASTMYLHAKVFGDTSFYLTDNRLFAKNGFLGK